MKVAMIGTGYVGLVSGVCFAEIGHVVTCIDVNPKKIEMLQKGQSPIYEPGLTELLERNIKAKRLFFAMDFSSIGQVDVVFLAVGTPSDDAGNADLNQLFSAVSSIVENLVEGTIIVIKSTVPIGTSDQVEKFIKTRTSKKFYLVNNPEFLKEGSAIDDFMRPDRVVIGCSDEHSTHLMEELYAPLVRQGNPIIRMSNISAEMTKYAANCFLATKISFINEMARICDAVNADIEEVRKGITSDKRIGPHFLYPGPGYGGSCFPKDVRALVHKAKELKVETKIIDAAELVNQTQKTLLFEKMKKHFQGDIKGKTFAMWGVAFKPNTDDIRESPAIYMCREIIKAGGRINYYDPVAAENFEAFMAEDGVLKKCPEKYECLDGTHGLIVLTDWAEFKAPNLEELTKRLIVKVIFDGRNLYNTKEIQGHGLTYYAFGKYIPPVSMVQTRKVL